MKPKPGLFSSWKVASEQGGGPRAQGKHQRMGRKWAITQAPTRAFLSPAVRPEASPTPLTLWDWSPAVNPLRPRGAVITNSAEGCSEHSTKRRPLQVTWDPPLDSPLAPPSSPYLGNFGFILLFGGLEGLVMVPGAVIVHQLPPSLGNA